MEREDDRNIVLVLCRRRDIDFILAVVCDTIVCHGESIGRGSVLKDDAVQLVVDIGQAKFASITKAELVPSGEVLAFCII